MLDLLQIYLHDVFFGVLALFMLFFVGRFFIPAIIVRSRLSNAIKTLKRIQPKDTQPATDLDQVAKEVMLTPQLKHCWAEFRETLHPQKQTDEYGQEKIVRWRSTALADTFFTEQALVETPLKTEYYKHLPGILTGIGIIATFSGLIFGLMDFQISEDANVVRSSLAGLVQSVGQAFILSVSAIGLAMFITWVEKSLVTACFKQVEGLCQGIDSLFEAGAGEEYLARLVAAAEESATQSAQMKDSLVTDLKQILTELTEMQIKAASAHHQQLSEAVVGAINESLREPMTQLSAGMNSVARDQGTAINSLLTDVLSSFTAKMDDMFGAQMRGMNDALVQTSLAIQTAAGKFDQLASNLNTAGQGAAESMNQRVESMMTAMEERQQAMNDRMAEFVEALRTNLADSQSESARHTQSMLTELGQNVADVVTQLQENANHSRDQQSAQIGQIAHQMGEFVGHIEKTVAYSQDKTATKVQTMLKDVGEQTGQLLTSLDARNIAAMQAQQDLSASFARETEGTVTRIGEQAAALLATLDARNVSGQQAQQESHARFAQETQSTIAKLAEHADKLSRSVESATESMRAAIGDLAAGGREHITQLNRGADTLNAASTNFGNTLEGFSSSANSVVETSKHLSESAQKLQSVVALSNQALSGHQAAQAAFGNLVNDLKVTVENASRDARLTSELVGTLEAASRKVADVQEQAETYLATVNTVLAEAHLAFATSIKGTLREGNKDFHTELGKAVDVLRGAILDLGETLEMVPAKV